MAGIARLNGSTSQSVTAKTNRPIGLAKDIALKLHVQAKEACSCKDPNDDIQQPGRQFGSASFRGED
jgi:hypothetical protein